MDLRVKKTERAIRQAFYQLILTKPLEKITVKELAELAEINKTTFYAHYETIYDLLETLEQETIDMIVAHLDSIHVLFDDPAAFVRSLYHTFHDLRMDMIQTHTSGRHFFRKLTDAITERAYAEGFDPVEYSHLGILMDFLISGLLSIQKSSQADSPEEPLSDQELDYLAAFVEGGIRALPPDMKL